MEEDGDDTGRRRNGRPPPAWLDGHTAVVIGTIVTVGIAISGLILGTTMATRQEMQRLHTETANVRRDLGASIEDVRIELSASIEDVRTELSARIEGVRTELSARIEGVRKELLLEIKAVDNRLRVVEKDIAAIRSALDLTYAHERDSTPPP